MAVTEPGTRGRWRRPVAAAIIIVLLSVATFSPAYFARFTISTTAFFT